MTGSIAQSAAVAAATRHSAPLSKTEMVVLSVLLGLACLVCFGAIVWVELRDWRRRQR